MPARIATSPVDDLDGLKALLQATPETIEQGFRILEIDLPSGEVGPIDALGVDRGGALVVLSLSSPEPDVALSRLLDQFNWVTDQRHLLARAYSLDPPDPTSAADTSSVRCLLLAGGFSQQFLKRLDLIRVPVTPYLVRRVEWNDENGFLVEPAAGFYGLDRQEPRPERPPDLAETLTLPPLETVDELDPAWPGSRSHHSIPHGAPGRA